MKLLWLCNMVPGAVKQAITGKEGNGLWVDHVLEDLRRQEDLEIRILCPNAGASSGTVDPRCSYATFETKRPYQYLPETETLFRKELTAFKPDVVHIWGTEYAHTLAMVNAAEKENCLDRVVISIQGLCSIYAGHYAEGVPGRVIRRATFRDLLRQDNIPQQRKKFVLRGELELQALKKTRHIIGRTCWDKACAAQINPEAAYHYCNETLRPSFYEDQWSYETCCKHRIFASSCVYPVKGFHYLLEAFAEVVKRYPDATLAVPGRSFLKANPLRQGSYQKYLSDLAARYGLEDRIEFLGSLNADGMKQAYLQSNIFVLPSTIENSPNSLGEAMLLAVPCVAADVGGVTTMMTHEKEGFVYQSTAAYMLAHYICSVFAMEDKAASMGMAARNHALKTHDPETNLRDLLDIYQEIGK